MDLYTALNNQGFPTGVISGPELAAIQELRSMAPDDSRLTLPPSTWRACVPRRRGGHHVRLVGLLGKPRAGKDAVALYFEETYRNVASVAFSDAIVEEVNDLLATLGWAVRVTESNKSDSRIRRVLQDWGVRRRVLNGPFYWANRVLGRAAELADDGAELVFITGARTPEDVRTLAEVDAALWKVVRPGNTYTADHPIERQLDHVSDDAWDALLLNEVEGDLRPLHVAAEAALVRAPQKRYLSAL